MVRILRTRLTLVWLLLVAATFAGWEAGRDGVEPLLVQAIIIAIALVKVRFVVMEFMELRLAPWPWRRLFDLWAVLLGAAILAMPFIAAPQGGADPARSSLI